MGVQCILLYELHDEHTKDDAVLVYSHKRSTFIIYIQRNDRSIPCVSTMLNWGVGNHYNKKFSGGGALLLTGLEKKDIRIFHYIWPSSVQNVRH